MLNYLDLAVEGLQGGDKLKGLLGMMIGKDPEKRPSI